MRRAQADRLYTPAVNRLTTLGVCSFFLLLGGCPEDGEEETAGTGTGATEGDEGTGTDSAGSDNEFPTFATTIDASAACATTGATEVAFEATRFDCLGGGPCTVPNPPRAEIGTTIMCPSEEMAAAVEVPVEQTGRYWVEVVVRLDDDTEQRECYSTDPANTEMLIGDLELQNAPTIMVDGVGGGPCDG